MKRILCIVLLLTGCATMNISVDDGKGGKCAASINRLFWVTAMYEGKMCGAEIGATGSQTDPMAQAIADALLRAAVKP